MNEYLTVKEASIWATNHMNKSVTKNVRFRKVANEFWDFLSGNGAYDLILNIFEKVGINMRDEIDDYFKGYNI
jgi:hypothetical protein